MREVLAAVILCGNDDAQMVKLAVDTVGEDDVPVLDVLFPPEPPPDRIRLTVYTTLDPNRGGNVYHTTGTDLWEIHVYHHMAMVQEPQKYVLFYNRREAELDTGNTPAVSRRSDVVVFRQSLNRAGVVFTSLKVREDMFGLHGVFL